MDGASVGVLVAIAAGVVVVIVAVVLIKQAAAKTMQRQLDFEVASAPVAPGQWAELRAVTPPGRPVALWLEAHFAWSGAGTTPDNDGETIQVSVDVDAGGRRLGPVTFRVGDDESDPPGESSPLAKSTEVVSLSGPLPRTARTAIGTVAMRGMKTGYFRSIVKLARLDHLPPGTAVAARACVALPPGTTAQTLRLIVGD